LPTKHLHPSLLLYFFLITDDANNNDCRILFLRHDRQHLQQQRRCEADLGQHVHVPTRNTLDLCGLYGQHKIIIILRTFYVNLRTAGNLTYSWLTIKFT